MEYSIVFSSYWLDPEFRNRLFTPCRFSVIYPEQDTEVSIYRQESTVSDRLRTRSRHTTFAFACKQATYGIGGLAQNMLLPHIRHSASGDFMQTLLQNLRYAIGQLRRSQGFTLTIVVLSILIGNEFLSSIAMAEPKHVPTVAESLNLKYLASPQISPDGRFIAYTIQEVDWKNDRYVNQLWLADTLNNTNMQLTRGSSTADS